MMWCWIEVYAIFLCVGTGNCLMMEQYLLHVLVHLHGFSNIATKGDNFFDFLFACLYEKAPKILSPLFKDRICSKRSKFFPLRVDPHCKGRQN